MSTNSLNQFTAKSILFLGYGREIQSAIKFFRENTKADSLAVFDSNLDLKAEDSSVKFYLGNHTIIDLPSFDVIVRSPGFPFRLFDDYVSRHSNTVVTSATRIFLEAHRERCIGVTGTKGKSTTSSLLFRILDRAIGAELVGNIGIPALDKYHSTKLYFVFEMSSFQLDEIDVSPHIAIFLNIFEEHLDYHGSFESYFKAKTNIFLHQTEKDKLVLPSGNKFIITASINSRSEKLFFDDHSAISWIEDGYFYYRDIRNEVIKLCLVSSITLKGLGNLKNVLAVLAALRQFDIEPSILTQEIQNFSPLPHRLEHVCVLDGVSYINDSISTVPQATMNALEAYSGLVSTLILGGFDRGIDFSAFAAYLKNAGIPNLIFFPPSGLRMRKEIEVCMQHGDTSIKVMKNVESMEEAVLLARSLSSPQSVCLLSPASPSFPIFKNFEYRGQAFKELLIKHL